MCIEAAVVGAVWVALISLWEAPTELMSQCAISRVSCTIILYFVTIFNFIICFVIHVFKVSRLLSTYVFFQVFLPTESFMHGLSIINEFIVILSMQLYTYIKWFSSSHARILVTSNLPCVRGVFLLLAISI
jgi:hypothetical protein